MSQIHTVEDFMLTHNLPNVTSINDSTHLFHFSETDWRKSELIFVNRNGNHMRIVFDPRKQQYRLAKHWSHALEVTDWTLVKGPGFSDPERVLAMITSIGSGKGAERLSLLPREVTGRGRYAVARNTMFGLTFDKGLETCTVRTLDGSHRATVKGKIWESAEAIKFCLEHLNPVELESMSPLAQTTVYEREKNILVAAQAMEQHPLFGAF